MSTLRGFLAGGIATVAVVEFFLWGMGTGGIGKTIFFFLLIAAYYMALGFPAGPLRNRIEHFILMSAVGIISLTYTIYNNTTLDLMNFTVNTSLLLIAFLQGVIGDRLSWDRFPFWLETALGWFVRPFAKITAPWSRFRLAGKSGDRTQARNAIKVILQIFFAILISVPILLVLCSLLFQSDPVFQSVFTPFFQYFAYFRLDQLIMKGFVFLLLLPFVLSAIWSYIDRFTVLKVEEYQPKSTDKEWKIPAPFALTVLFFVNLLYLVYAFVQFQYLFGASGGILPDHLTYADYARSGFFELAFVSFLNVILILVSVRFTKREKAAGVFLRVATLLMLFLSGVQLASALLRMGLYIQVYGLSILRYFVTAFMLLVAVIFILLLVREFRKSFPLLKSFVFAGAAALILLNFSSPDESIAKYNVEGFLSGRLSQFDAGYLTEDLSASGDLVLLDYEDALIEVYPSIRDFTSNIRNRVETTAKVRTQEEYKLFNLSYARLEEKVLSDASED